MSNESTNNPRRGAVTLLLLGAALVTLTGCQTARVEQPLTATLAGNDDDSQVAFWHGLNEQPVASHDDAFHALLLFMDSKDDSADYAARVDTLRQRQMLPKNFEGEANAAITRGTLSVAIVKLLEIKGGITMRVLGPLPRYATRELQYVGVYPPSAATQIFSGSQFLAVMGRVEDYQRLKKVEPTPRDIDENAPKPPEGAPPEAAPAEGAPADDALPKGAPPANTKGPTAQPAPAA